MANEPDIKALVATKHDDLAAMFPEAAQAERFKQSLFQLWADPNSGMLRQCRPETILAGMMAVAEVGLTLSKQLGHAYLVPFKGTAVPVIGYRGLIHLALQSGGAIDIRAFARHQNDSFTFSPVSLREPINHVVNLDNPGPVIGYYAIAVITPEIARAEYMSKAQVEKHRDMFAKSKEGPWSTMFDEMAKKTVIRRLAKYLRLSGKADRAFEMATQVEPITDAEDFPDNLASAAVEPEVVSATSRNTEKLALKADAPKKAEADRCLTDKEQQIFFDMAKAKGLKMARLMAIVFDTCDVNEMDEVKVSQIDALTTAINEAE